MLWCPPLASHRENCASPSRMAAFHFLRSLPRSGRGVPFQVQHISQSTLTMVWAIRPFGMRMTWAPTRAAAFEHSFSVFSLRAPPDLQR